MTARPLRSVVAAALLLHGCTTMSVEPEPGPPPPGALTAHAGRAGLVIAAPHGTSDAHTGEIAAEIARRTGFGVVIATGFTMEPGGERSGRRLPVNRPTEDVPRRLPAEEIASVEASRVSGEFERRVRGVSGGPLQLYVEVHGSGGREGGGRIEVATVGLGPDDAWRVRTLLELVRDARVGMHPGAPRLTVLVEPVDRVRHLASGAEPAGILRLPMRALHIALPPSARTDWRALYTDVLAQFVSEAAPLLVADPGASVSPVTRR